jgi:hypothetical protein
MSASKQRPYRVTFHEQAQVYEVYAGNVSHGSMGFVEIERLVFGETPFPVHTQGGDRKK